MAQIQDSHALPPDIAAELALRDALALAQTGVPAGQRPDHFSMLISSDAGLRGEALVRHWDEIGRGEGGFYDHIREHGCTFCGSHTPGCCDGCA